MTVLGVKIAMFSGRNIYKITNFDPGMKKSCRSCLIMLSLRVEESLQMVQLYSNLPKSLWWLDR
jgi:hypothetical protein